MVKPVPAFLGLCALLALPLTTGAASDCVCRPGASASINVVATVIEPMGLMAPTATGTDRASNSAAWLLRLPESSHAVIHLTAPDQPEISVRVTPHSGPLDQVDSDLVGRYRNGTLTVIFTDN